MSYRLKNYSSFATANLKELFGAKRHYCIRGGYRHRKTYSYFDDTDLKDEWQNEVYIRASDLAAEKGLRTVYDIGCGSGYKLIKYLSEYNTVGFDVPETIEFLNRTYPDRSWKSSKLADRDISAADLVICADVIEHVLDPDELMSFIRSVAAKWVVLSTPDRGLVYPRLSPYLLGPPRNTSHVREWSFNEFERFVSKFLTIKEHVISNRQQATQMIVGLIR